MALIKIKQINGLQTNLDNLGNSITALSVDSKDASVLAAASSSATDLSVDSKDASVIVVADTAAASRDTALSVDSKDASVIVVADTAAASRDTALSVDSKDASVLSAADTAAASRDTALSVDSKDASVLAAAQSYADEKANDDFGTGTIIFSVGQVDEVDGTLSNDTVSFTPTTMDYTIGGGRVLSGTNANEYEENIMYVMVNGVIQDSTQIVMTSNARFTLTVPFNFDDDDIIEVKYNWENA